MLLIADLITPVFKYILIYNTLCEYYIQCYSTTTINITIEFYYREGLPIVMQCICCCVRISVPLFYVWQSVSLQITVLLFWIIWQMHENAHSSLISPKSAITTRSTPPTKIQKTYIFNMQIDKVFSIFTSQSIRLGSSNLTHQPLGFASKFAFRTKSMNKQKNEAIFHNSPLLLPYKYVYIVFVL